MQKVEKLRQIGSSFAENIKPMLNPEQQQKFQAVRERVRDRLIEKMAGEARQKVEVAVKEKVQSLKQGFEVGAPN